MLLSYRVEDDYGATEAHATFARKDEPAAKGDGPHPLYGPPDFSLVLPQALVEQRRNLALDARVRSQVITAVDALTLGPDKFRTEAGIYLGLRSIFWSLVRAKSDDDLREVAARLWSMAVRLEDGDISEAQAALRAAQEALRNALDRGASDQELKQLMDQLRAAMDRFMQAMQEQLKNNQQLTRPLDRNARVLRSQDLKNLLDRLENMARNGAKDAARELLQQLEQMMENLQMATPDMNGEHKETHAPQSREATYKGRSLLSAPRTGRVEDWRAGLGRCSCSLLSHYGSFVALARP